MHVSTKKSPNQSPPRQQLKMKPALLTLDYQDKSASHPSPVKVSESVSAHRYLKGKQSRLRQFAGLTKTPAQESNASLRSEAAVTPSVHLPSIAANGRNAKPLKSGTRVPGQPQRINKYRMKKLSLERNALQSPADSHLFSNHIQAPRREVSVPSLNLEIER